MLTDDRPDDDRAGWLAHYLSQPIRRYETCAVSDPGRLAEVRRPADILLVDGNSRVSTAIKYLTQINLVTRGNACRRLQGYRTGSRGRTRTGRGGPGAG